jgi:hypothetical protein
MDERIRKLLDNIPERPPRSRLEPHIDVIRELRRKRRSYQEISVFFKEHLHIPVAPSTLFEFVKSRARPAKKPMVELPETAGSATQK